MEKFTASNGWTVTELEDGQGSVMRPAGNREYVFWLGPTEADTLREFFQAERDAELGRWRWSENTDVVVRVNGPDPNTVEVYDEDSGLRATISRGGLGFEDFEPYLMRAARDYFNAHPVPRPWEDAKPGEVWLVVLDCEEQAVIADRFGTLSTHEESLNSPEFTRISAGRRIWPEGETTP